MKLQSETSREGMLPKGRSHKSLIGVIVALLALAALGGLAWYLTHRPADGPAGPGPGAGRRGGPPASTVGVAAAERAGLPVIVEALGTVTATANAIVRAKVSGELKQIHFHEGQMVKAGELLATIDPRQFEMALMQASGQLRRDQAQLENAKQTLARYRTLLAQDSIARQDVDVQAALVRQLEGTVMTDHAAEGTARLNLGYTRVTAPIAGRIGLRSADLGNVVGPSDANGIAAITQTEPIDVEFAVPQDRIVELRRRINEGATLPVSALDRTRTEVLDTGSFLAMDNQVDVQTGTVKAKARFANSQHVLFPSQFVNVRLLLRTVEDAIVVPVAAVRHGSSGDFVYVLNPAQHTVVLRPVTRGLLAGDKVQIASGLAAGEQVITEGADRLKDGARVNLPGERRQSGRAQDGSGQTPANERRRRREAAGQ
ncbi:efflux RND transporter periplasmic adaptor subunit [Noviherbaspirillum autotrophicum]|uniref:Secretion protein HlyD n=1 Tax=Noviherbaspirillum autotrophicum TaxID=709839 RepID=A0A0C2BTK4_9BURK|nr:efflux RND transporter periplasmic adaptor subunit [Noviherbaspirillum autotrophicum]KIF83354.1 secretion protein HlyD [Noviherbaspirillum autotrophicum]